MTLLSAEILTTTRNCAKIDVTKYENAPGWIGVHRGLTPQIGPVMRDHSTPDTTEETTKEIPLTKGYVAIVDATDYEWLSQWRWYAFETHHTVYAVRAVWCEGRSKTIRMHREILDLGPGQEADHIDRDGLNNTRSNLRVATSSQNNTNRGMLRSNTSGFRGVHFFRARGRWQAHIKVGQKKLHLGYFDAKEDAARAYDVAALEHFGEYAVLNFPDGAENE